MSILIIYNSEKSDNLHNVDLGKCIISYINTFVYLICTYLLYRIIKKFNFVLYK